MEEQNETQSSENIEQESPVNAQSQTIDVNNTAIVEYLEIVRSEYETERNKKQSFENRAGLIMALLGAICIFLFEKVKLQDIVYLMTTSLTFVELTKIITGLAVYVCFAFTMAMIVFTITVKQHNNFEVKNINETLLGEQRIVALCRIILTYKSIIIQHRELNEKRASAFRKSLYGICATLVSIIIYISLI